VSQVSSTFPPSQRPEPALASAPNPDHPHPGQSKVLYSPIHPSNKGKAVGLINHILGAEKVAGKRVQRGCRLEPALLGSSSSASLSNSACCFFENRELAWFLRGEVVGRHQTRAWRERESGPGTPKAMRAVSKVSVNLSIHPSVPPSFPSFHRTKSNPR